ncbi:MAG: hypothetical protein JO110_18695 [Acetobacteraceae bacterium]|nr:hypothetical protein [Acetobacteraceae bacterium]
MNELRELAAAELDLIAGGAAPPLVLVEAIAHSVAYASGPDAVAQASQTVYASFQRYFTLL